MLHKGFRINDCLPTGVLVHLAEDGAQPGAKRWAALLALSGQDTSEAYEVIHAALASPDPDMRRYAIEAISRHPLARKAEGAIAAMLFDVDDLVGQTACKICGVLHLESAHDGVLQLLKSENPDVRDMALNTLARLWRDHDFEPVLELHRNDDRRAVRIAAAKTLRHRVTRHTWRRLFGLWCRDREPRHRLWSCELAGEFGGKDDLGAVVPLLRDRNRNVRMAAERSVHLLSAAR